MKSVKVSTPYTPLTQQRLCCVPCAVQWILLRRKLSIFTQEKIGKALKLAVPKEYAKLFPKGGVTVPKKKPILGYGSQASEGATAYNRFLKRNKVPLKVKYIKHSRIDNAEELIAPNLKKGNDVMIITFMSAIDKKKPWGHALLVSEIVFGKRTSLVLGDPSFSDPKFWEAPLDKVLKGMTKKVGKTERGIYIFSKI